MDSILISIKNLLGITENYNQFDQDLIIHINSVFSILNQLGVGPKDGFEISGKNESWSDFIDDNQKIRFVKSYIYLKVKMLFDPPISNATIESINKTISELEWRLNIVSDSTNKE